MQKSKGKADIWLMRFTSRQQCEVLRELSKSKNIRISLSTVCPNNINLQKKILSKYKTKILDNNKISYLDKKYFKNVSFGAKFNSDIINLYELPSYHNYIALQNLERFERYTGEISFEERNYLIKMQHLFWSKLLLERRPKLVVFGDIPHHYYEFVLMNLLSKLNIKSLIVGDINRDKNFFMNNKFKLIKNLSSYTFSEASHERFKNALKSTQTEYDKVLNKSPFQELPRYFKLFFKKIIGLIFFFFYRKKYYAGYYIRKGYFKFGPNNKFNELFYEIKYLLKCILFPFIYKLYTSKVSFKKDYLYFPLISCFENVLHPNLSPLILKDVIKSALGLLKPNQYLYIKEHPAQFVFRNHQRFARNVSFYRDISKLDKRIKFIEMKEKPSKIIKNSLGVFAMNVSSSIVEAKAFKKKIFCIGSNPINGIKAYPFSELTESNKETKFFNEGSIWVKNPIQSLNIVDKEKAKKMAKSIMKQITIFNNED